LIFAGRLAESDELLTSAYAQLEDEPLAETKAYVGLWYAFLRLEQGRPLSAFRIATESYQLFEQLGRPFRSRFPQWTAAHALALTGQASRAVETLAALDARGYHTNLIYETDLLQARAWTAASGGDLPRARDYLGQAADLGEEIGDLVGALSAQHGLARLGRARQVAGRMADLASHVEGDLAAARAGYALTVATHDSDALQGVSREFERLGNRLYAAEGFAEAAVILSRSGEARKAAAAERQAARVLSQCEGATTPAVRHLTARVRTAPSELDTAVQAAAGRSNKEIATDLHLSVRTVENRLQRVYEKLGVSGRNELAEALRDLPGR